MNQNKECLIGMPGVKGLVNLCSIPPNQINLHSIVRTLSKYPRFGARGKIGVSVLRHSYLVCLILRRWGYNERFQLGGLCHDFSEAFIGDLIQPIKSMLPEFKELEDSVMLQISEVFDCGHYDSVEVKNADIAALKVEAVYEGFCIEDWNLPEIPKPYSDLNTVSLFFESEIISNPFGEKHFMNLVSLMQLT